ncbi:Flp family type IVb pilin [Pseudomonas sp. 15FMM2]|uniref:Flp family type IVb pilin n=1 Tax=Pseudomonas imrae TaxID=2992837 RepID=A0ACC7PEX9_9PSED
MFLELILKICIQTQQFFRRKDGASAIEYVVIVSIVALVLLTYGNTLGNAITSFFGRIVTGISVGS